MSGEMDKIKKKLDDLEVTVKKHASAAEHSEKKRIDDLEARLKALEEKIKKK